MSDRYTDPNPDLTDPPQARAPGGAGPQRLVPHLPGGAPGVDAGEVIAPPPDPVCERSKSKAKIKKRSADGGRVLRTHRATS